MKEATERRVAKKRLGQNFLSSPHYAKVMVAAVEITPGETILEIGPGTGILTEEILRAGAKVVAVEKDQELLPTLQKHFQKEIANNQLTLIRDSILDFPLTSLKTTNYKLVSNIPYNLTGEILRLFIGGKHQPSRALLMVQKEVADRILRKNGKGSILSMSVSCYGEPKRVALVPRGNFRPMPKVDSAIIAIENISRKFFKSMDEEKAFFRVLKTGFAHKRKMLIGNLGGVFGKTQVETAFADLKIDAKTRAENISLKEWLFLTRKLFP